MARIMVTGCSSGIGRATCILLTERGHEVVATARSLAPLADLSVADRIALDVTSDESVAAAVEAAGAIDGLVNNAGLAMWGAVELTQTNDMKRLFDTNVFGVIRLCRAVLPGMRTRGHGRIVQISSGAARRPQPLVGLYCASKAALESLSMALRIEARDFGVDVAIVGMGAVDSNISQNRIVSDATGTPYAPPMRAMLDRMQSVRGKAVSADEAASVVVSVLESENPPFRTYVGEGFAEELEAVNALSTDEYEERFHAIYASSPAR